MLFTAKKTPLFRRGHNKISLGGSQRSLNLTAVSFSAFREFYGFDGPNPEVEFRESAAAVGAFLFTGAVEHGAAVRAGGGKDLLPAACIFQVLDMDQGGGAYGLDLIGLPLALSDLRVSAFRGLVRPEPQSAVDADLAAAFPVPVIRDGSLVDVHVGVVPAEPRVLIVPDIQKHCVPEPLRGIDQDGDVLPVIGPEDRSNAVLGLLLEFLPGEVREILLDQREGQVGHVRTAGSRARSRRRSSPH